MLRKKYGLDLEGFSVVWMACRGRCGICDKQMKWPQKGRGQGLDVVAIDHDHATGRMRGLLCNACNKGLGFFGDDVKKIKLALHYLENHRGSKAGQHTKDRMDSPNP